MVSEYNHFIYVLDNDGDDALLEVWANEKAMGTTTCDKFGRYMPRHTSLTSILPELWSENQIRYCRVFDWPARYSMTVDVAKYLVMVWIGGMQKTGKRDAISGQKRHIAYQVCHFPSHV